MSDNPYSSPKQQAKPNGSRERRSIRSSPAFFIFVSFALAWVTFYSAYSANVFSNAYLEQYMGLALFTVWIGESVVASLIVTGLAAISFLFGGNVRRRNYVVLATLCSLEFVMTFWFFVAFFGV